MGVVSHNRWLRDAFLAVLSASPAFFAVDFGDGEAGTFERLRHVPPIVVLASLPTLHAIEFVREVQQIAPRVRVVLLGNEDTEPGAVSLFEAGLTGLTLPSDSLGDLRVALENAVLGKMTCPSHVVAALVQRFRQRGETGRQRTGIDGLTAREQQVMDFLELGQSNKEIAALLGIEVSTVKTHVHRVLAKTAVVRHRSVSVPGTPSAPGSRS